MFRLQTAKGRQNTEPVLLAPTESKIGCWPWNWIRQIKCPFRRHRGFFSRRKDANQHHTSYAGLKVRGKNSCFVETDGVNRTPPKHQALSPGSLGSEGGGNAGATTRQFIRLLLSKARPGTGGGFMVSVNLVNLVHGIMSP